MEPEKASNNLEQDPEKTLEPIPSSRTEQETDQETDKDLTFPEAYRRFLDFCDQVLKYDSCGNLLSASSKPSKVQAPFANYRKVFEKTSDSPKHVDKIKVIYDDCRRRIKDDPELDNFMEWFRTTSFIIAPTDRATVKFHVSAIFRNTIRIADSLNDLAKQHPEDVEKYENDPAMTYPEKFMLHLFRLFVFVCSGKDLQDFMADRITLLEEILGLAKNENPPAKSEIDELLSVVTGFASEAGIQVPVGMGQISVKQMTEGLGAMRGNDQALSMVKNFFSGVNMNDPNSLTTALGKVTEQMKNNAQQIPEPVQRSLNARAEEPIPSSSQLLLPSTRK